MRGYTFEQDLEYGEDDQLTLKSQIREEMVNKLAKEWNQINRQIEMDSWRSRDERMDEEDWHADQAEACADSDESKFRKENPNLSEEEYQAIREKSIEAYWAAKRKKDNEIYLRRDVIEELLSDLGARMMRPYEHWNEQEREMEYLESRYEDERDWDY